MQDALGSLVDAELRFKNNNEQKINERPPSNYSSSATSVSSAASSGCSCSCCGAGAAASASDGSYNNYYHCLYSSSGCTTRRSSCETTASSASSSVLHPHGCCSYSRRKPHKSHDLASAAIRALKLRGEDITLSSFNIVRKLGQGDIGSVYLAQLRGCSSYLFAMKVVDREALAKKNKVQRMYTERHVLELVDHPFLPTLYAHFDVGQYSCLLTEFCGGGDLHMLRHRQPCNRFSVKAVRFYAAQVLVALEYLHMLGIVYRDLKPENVLVRDDGHIMLTDFDLCVKCEVDPAMVNLPASYIGSSKKRRLLRRSLRKLAAAPPCKDTSTATPRGSNHAPQFQLAKRSGSIAVLYGQMFSCFRALLGIRSGKGKGRDDTNRRRSSTSTKTTTTAEVVYPELVAEPMNVRSMSMVGTHEYLAPEVVSGSGHGSAVDWWMLGVLLYELLFGRTPFKGGNHQQTLHNIVRQPLRFPEGAIVEVGESALCLIQGLLTKDPRKRLGSVRGASELKQHPFFRSVNWALIRTAKPPPVDGRRRRGTIVRQNSGVQYTGSVESKQQESTSEARAQQQFDHHF